MRTVIELKRVIATITAKNPLENRLPALRDDLNAKREAVKAADKNFAGARYVETHTTRMREAEHRKLMAASDDEQAASVNKRAQLQRDHNVVENSA